MLNFKIPKGATGNDGKSFAIKGRFDTLEMLMEAHPNGAAGDAYVVGVGDDSYLYVWNEDIAFWDNMGHFQIAKGDPGISPTVSIASTTTGEPGTAAIVQNIGTDQNVKLAFTIPAGNTGATGSQGPAGKAATIKIGEVITGETGTQASVVNTGTETDAVLRVTLPRGERGQTGNTGETGERGISIANAQVNADYHLIVTLSTGETIDAGYVRGATGSTGATGAQGPKGDTPTSIPASGVTGVMTIQQGGTGKSTAEEALYNLISLSEDMQPFTGMIEGSTKYLSSDDYIPLGGVKKGGTLKSFKITVGDFVNGLESELESATSIRDYDGIVFYNNYTAKKITLANLKAALGVSSDSSGGTFIRKISYTIPAEAWTNSGSYGSNYRANTDEIEDLTSSDTIINIMPSLVSTGAVSYHDCEISPFSRTSNRIGFLSKTKPTTDIIIDIFVSNL